MDRAKANQQGSKPSEISTIAKNYYLQFNGARGESC